MYVIVGIPQKAKIDLQRLLANAAEPQPCDFNPFSAMTSLLIWLARVAENTAGEESNFTICQFPWLSMLTLDIAKSGF